MQMQGVLWQAIELGEPDICLALEGFDADDLLLSLSRSLHSPALPWVGH